MKRTSPQIDQLEVRLRRLARRLGRTGFISQGSVFERRKSGSGSRYQWTWKDPHQKTVSLTLSAQQFIWLQKAIARSRAVEATLEKMRQLSRRVVLEYLPGPKRRKSPKIKSLRPI
jgi:hypothetical protein